MHDLAKFIPWLPFLAAVICGLLAMKKQLKVFASIVALAGILGSFLISVYVANQEVTPYLATRSASDQQEKHHVKAFNWINVGWQEFEFSQESEAVAFQKKEVSQGKPAELITRYVHEDSHVAHDTDESHAVNKAGDDRVDRKKLTKFIVKSPQFSANFSYFFDSLTIVMLFVITGIGSLVVIYASGYMEGDVGYARFFAFVSLFIFSMTNLVMADNLVLLYLGWEGVGLCSYLLIGFYYKKKSAVAAAKKAFIVNRIGDLGFALGIFLIFKTYDTVNLSEVIAIATQKLEGDAPLTTADWWIPFLLMLGAFGKSAQLPLYVWLPDAMEGPTPVSALIHAATMVTAGVYMIARLITVFQLSPEALPTVATIGGLTAFFAATIALFQNDIKRVFAYSTISQLGYMFLGVGVLSTFGAVFHLFTHAFFKALLFLTAGSVMHAMAGQLDMNKMSGMQKHMPQTKWLMLIGCLALAGLFPFAGFFSKDTIIADVLIRAQAVGNGSTHPGYFFLTILALITAFMTAFYTFRLWFRVFTGPEKIEMGDDHHGDDHPTHPHEMPFIMNAPLVILAIGSVLGGYGCYSWMKDKVANSTAQVIEVAHHGHADHAAHEVSHGEKTAHAGHAAEGAAESATEAAHHASHYFMGMEIHALMAYVSSVLAVLGIFIAWYYHARNREAADRIAANMGTLRLAMMNKWYVDEIYHATIVSPLKAMGNILFIVDRMIIDGLVFLISQIPVLTSILGRWINNGHDPLPWSERIDVEDNRAQLQGYGLGMAAGLAIVLMLIFVF